MKKEVINLSGKNIDIIGSYVYVYTTQPYLELKNDYHKIGGTDTQSVRSRVIEQDNTSNPDPLIILRVYELKGTRFDGNSNSAEIFIRKGFRRTRLDTSREWRIAKIELIDKNAKKIDKDITKVDIELLKHQIESLEFINDKFKTFNEVLLYHIPRSGKSYITIKYLSENIFKNVLFLTNYPILNQQWIEIINKTKGFDDVIVLNFSKDDDKFFINEGYDPTKRYIFFVSFQDIKGKDGVLNKEKFKDFKFIDFDLLVIDEIHKGKETIKSDEIFKILKYKKLLGLSATPTKNLIRGTFNNDNTHRFGVEDIMKYKKLYPEQYSKIPSIRYFLYDINKLHREELKKFYKEEEYFTWTKFLRVVDGKLKYKNLVRSFLINHFVGGNIGYDNAPINEFNPNSALIFAEHNDSLSLIKELLDSIPYIDTNYEVHFTNSEKNNSSELMELIEGDFKPNESIGKGSIIIANRQLTTGITLEEVDMVVFMNDWSSMDEYIQASYRCLTAVEGKKNGYVIDYLPSRTFNIMYQLIDSQAKVKGIPFEQAVSDYFKCAPMTIFDDNQFKDVDVNNFMKELVKSLDIKNVFSNSTLLFEQIEKYQDMFEGFNVGESIKISVSKKLNEDSDDKGKNKILKGLIGEKGEKLETLQNAIENSKYILDRTLLLTLYTNFKYENIDDIFKYIKTKDELITIYLQSIMIDNVDIEVIQFVYDNCFDKDIINEKLIFINNIFIDLLSEKNIIKRVQNIQKIQELINSYLGVSDIEKTTMGEVFTPFWLINKKLDLYDKDDFKNPHFKWLFPSGGIGNYQFCVIERLMEGLKEWEPDDEKRYKHIIENQIYTCELQSKNIFIYLMLFDIDNKYNMNYYHGSFIDGEGFNAHLKKEWNNIEFDRSPENPPYNGPQKAKGKKGGGDLIWDQFVIKTIELLKTNGKMTFVHPAAWRKPESEKSKTKGLYKLMTDNQIHYLEIHNSVDGKKTFKANTRYDFYLLEKTKPYKNTKIVDEDGVVNDINLKDWTFLPNKNYDLIKPLIAKNEETCNIIYNRTNYGTDKDWISTKKDETYKYTLVHTTPKKGTRYVYSSRNDNGHFGISKIIFGDSGIYDVIIDMKGEYGMSQHSMAIPVTSITEAEQIKKVLLSNEFEKIIKATSWGNYAIDWRMFTYFKKDFWKFIKKDVNSK